MTEMLRRRMRRLLERLALISYKEPQPPDEYFPEDNYYEVMGILPMLWQWVKNVGEHAAYDLEISLKIIGDDHPRLRRYIRPIQRRLKELYD